MFLPSHLHAIKNTRADLDSFYYPSPYTPHHVFQGKGRQRKIFSSDFYEKRLM